MKVRIVSSQELTAQTLRASDYLEIERVSERVAAAAKKREAAIKRLMPLICDALDKAQSPALEKQHVEDVIRPGKKC